jgi:1-phosphatidylinositol phosphodiesterase
LRENPTECIIMSVQQESKPSANTRAFEHTFDAYVASNPACWRLAGNVPTLSQAAGKMVLLRRFRARALPKGIDATAWLTNTTFTITGPAGKLRVQDSFRLNDVQWKWKAIQNLYGEAQSGERDCLYINFTSGFTTSWFWGLPRIRAVSSAINPLLTAYFANEGHRRHGITVMDFANDRISSLIIATNRR